MARQRHDSQELPHPPDASSAYAVTDERLRQAPIGDKPQSVLEPGHADLERRAVAGEPIQRHGDQAGDRLSEAGVPRPELKRRSVGSALGANAPPAGQAATSFSIRSFRSATGGLPFLLFRAQSGDNR